jgi:GR25 family glycosyltransferase involved in LPS biosynthesis
MTLTNDRLLDARRTGTLGPFKEDERAWRYDLTYTFTVQRNLKRRPDRLKAFFDQLEEVGWPFPWPEVWDAVDGGSGKVPCPAEFTQGGGAWGCRQSHVAILEHCLMNDIGSVLVLEDDAFLRDNFLDDLKAFMAKVPDDWEDAA